MLNIVSILKLQVSFLSHNSRKFSHSVINTFSRGDAFECKIPPISAKNWISAKLACYSEPHNVLDPFSVTCLPSESQLNSWKDDIRNNGSMPWKYIETLGGRLNIDCINVLLKYHIAKGIQAAVEQEAKWFSTNYNKPTTVKQHLPAALIHDYQRMLYSDSYGKIWKKNGMSANELAMVCCNRWISSDQVSLLLKVLCVTNRYLLHFLERCFKC